MAEETSTRLKQQIGGLETRVRELEKQLADANSAQARATTIANRRASLLMGAQFEIVGLRGVVAEQAAMLRVVAVFEALVLPPPRGGAGHPDVVESIKDELGRSDT